MKQIEVGILGSTGMVGQHFVRFLEGHPWFRLTWLGASDRSAGKKFQDATTWRLGGSMPMPVRDITVAESKPDHAPRLLFSAMDASVATEIEQAFASAGHVVVSNSRNHRMEPDVPLLIPEVNPEHLKLIPNQQRSRGWKGMIVTNPNCSTIVLSMALAPMAQFGIQKIFATTLQAISGAGYPGVSSFDILGNIIPYIGSEEEKMECETQKILGTLKNGQVMPLTASLSAQCHRVAVVDGHTVATSVELSEKPSASDVIHAIESFQGLPQQKQLPSAPEKPLVYRTEADRPQPLRDIHEQNGMAVHVGRVRTCPVLDVKFVACGHNTIRGAAGAAVLNAELMVSEGLLD